MKSKMLTTEARGSCGRWLAARHLPRTFIKGVVCGVRVEDIKEPTMQEIRYLNKLIDELAKGKAMEKILRK
jgi:hypothetical protein